MFVLSQWDVLVVFTALQSKTDWKVTYTSSHICASKGSTVDINCNYKYPAIKSKSQSSSINLESLWFTKIDRNDPVNIEKETDYKGRVEYSCGENRCIRSGCSGVCTLRIRDLKPSDSAEYKFRITTAQTDLGYTGSPGVNLTVTGKRDNNIMLMWPKWELVMIIIPSVPFNVCIGLLEYNTLIESWRSHPHM